MDISSNIDARLNQGYLDLALQTGPFKSSAFTKVELGAEAYCWVANTEIAKQLRKVPSLSDFFDCTVLTHAKHTQSSMALQEVAAKYELYAGKIVHSNSLLACIPMVLEGMGVALLPERLVISNIESGELHKVDCDWLPDPLSFYARYAFETSPLFVQRAADLAVQAMRDHVA